jgi:hypothetical protein
MFPGGIIIFTASDKEYLPHLLLALLESIFLRMSCETGACRSLRVDLSKCCRGDCEFRCWTLLFAVLDRMAVTVLGASPCGFPRPSFAISHKNHLFLISCSHHLSILCLLSPALVATTASVLHDRTNSDSSIFQASKTSRRVPSSRMSRVNLESDNTSPTEHSSVHKPGLTSPSSTQDPRTRCYIDVSQQLTYQATRYHNRATQHQHSSTHPYLFSA